MPNLQDYDLRIDLSSGVVPISKASAALAALIARAHQQRHPIVLTQKGVPSAVLLDIDLYELLVAMVKKQG